MSATCNHIQILLAITAM